jgi:hypothetical protein
MYGVLRMLSVPGDDSGADGQMQRLANVWKDLVHSLIRLEYFAMAFYEKTTFGGSPPTEVHFVPSDRN